MAYSCSGDLADSLPEQFLNIGIRERRFPENRPSVLAEHWPEPVRSTLITSAPRSARIMLAAGPATIVLRSRPSENGGRPSAQVTPLVVNGQMYLTAGNRMVALEPETGKEIWNINCRAAAHPRAAWPFGQAIATIHPGSSSLPGVD